MSYFTHPRVYNLNYQVLNFKLWQNILLERNVLLGAKLNVDLLLYSNKTFCSWAFFESRRLNLLELSHNLSLITYCYNLSVGTCWYPKKQARGHYYRVNLKLSLSYLFCARNFIFRKVFFFRRFVVLITVRSAAWLGASCFAARLVFILRNKLLKFCLYLNLLVSFCSKRAGFVFFFFSKTRLPLTQNLFLPIPFMKCSLSIMFPFALYWNERSLFFLTVT